MSISPHALESRAISMPYMKEKRTARHALNDSLIHVGIIFLWKVSFSYYAKRGEKDQQLSSWLLKGNCSTKRYIHLKKESWSILRWGKIQWRTFHLKTAIEKERETIEQKRGRYLLRFIHGRECLAGRTPVNVLSLQSSFSSHTFFSRWHWQRTITTWKMTSFQLRTKSRSSKRERERKQKPFPQEDIQYTHFSS